MAAGLKGKTGDALSQAVARRQSNAVITLASLVGPLHSLHSCGLVHRDIKMENIMIGKDRKVRLLDLGICGEIGKAPRVSGGTSTWMTPASLIQPHHCTVQASHDW